MDIHIQRAWEMPKGHVFVALGWFVVGSIAGYLIGHEPAVSYSCTTRHLRAHFLERQIAFETPPIRSSSQQLRGAATEASDDEPSSAPSSLSSVAPGMEAPSSSTSAQSASSPAPQASDGASASSASAGRESDDFPAFEHAVYPVARIPNWGAMKTAVEWNRDYDEMDRKEFIRMPPYDLDDLTAPMAQILKKRDDSESIRLITAKLFYSTRFFGTYDVDAGEFTGHHAGIDLKLPEGTPVVSVAGGRVNAVIDEKSGLGLHVIIEHRLGDEAYYSIYGHLSAVGVTEGQDVAPGAYVGAVGNTGRSTLPHLHLQIDRGDPGERPHVVYWPGVVPTPEEAGRHTVHPMSFIAEHRL